MSDDKPIDAELEIPTDSRGRPLYYRLNQNHEAMPTTRMDGGVWDPAHRIIKQEYVAPDIWISTVFLVIDHSYGDGPPLLFETMVFRKGSGEECERCSTYEQALDQHRTMVARIQREIASPAPKEE